MYVYLSTPSVNPLQIRANAESLSIESTEQLSPSPTIHEDSSIITTEIHENTKSATSDDPLNGLINAAHQEDTKLVEENANIFLEYMRKLIDVAQTACQMSNQVEGAKLVRLAIMQIEDHSVQVVNAAQILATRSTSKIARDNMNVCRDTWEKYLCLLTEAIDDITTMEDYLAISEKHILDDIDKCLQGIIDRNLDHIEQSVRSIQKRSHRIIDAVTAEMTKHQSKQYIESVLITVNVLRYQILPKFSTAMLTAIKMVREHSMSDDDREYDFIEQEFIETSNRVYHGLRDIRNSLLIDPVSDFSVIDGTHLPTAEPTQSQSSEPDETSYTSYNLTSKQSASDHPKVPYWNDQDHDIVVLARKIGLIVMEMTEFTRGRGSMRTFNDIILAAKDISQCGFQLNQLAKEIADDCPASETKTDLMSYIDRISLYCHQLNVTRRVRADLDRSTNDLITNGLDNIKSLINTAANLINAIVLTVQALYIASTKSSSKTMLHWTRCRPEKKSWSILEQSKKMSSNANRDVTIHRLQLLDILNQFTKLK